MGIPLKLSQTAAGRVYEAGQWEVDLVRRELRLCGVRLPVGGRAFEIIEVLVKSAGNLVGKDDLMASVWPGMVVEETPFRFIFPQFVRRSAKIGAC